jgi:hypothetical protein
VIYFYCSLTFLVGFASGYGIRALVSRRRRAAARKEREWAKGRIVPLAAEENHPSQAGKVVRLTSEDNTTIQASQDGNGAAGSQRRGARPERP